MKKELILPIAILGLTITFGVICFLVYITGGIPSLIKKKMKIGALLLTFNAMVWGVSAQDDIDNPLSCYVQSSSAIYLGPNAGYNKTLCTNFPDNSIELSPKDINPNNIKQNLSGNGYFFGLSYYQFLGPKTGTKHAIILNLNYQKSSGNKDQILNDTSFINHWPHNTTVTKFIYHNEFSLSTLNFSILYDYNLIAGLCLDAGFNFDLKISDKYLVSVFLDKLLGQSIIYDGQITNMKNFNTGLLFELRYEFITGTKVDIVPYLGYKIGLTYWLNNWKTDNIYAGLHLRFAITNYF